MALRERKYILKLKDVELASFSARVDEFGVISAEMGDFDESRRRLLPMSMVQDPGGESFLAWAKSRTIPKNRRFVEKILAKAGLAQGDTLGILDTCKGLSPNDSYWLDDGSLPLGFDDINLFDNPIDEVLSYVAFTGYDTEQRRRAGLSTELTTDGSFAKAWRRIDGGLMLYKAGSEGFANAGMEPYSEFLCAQVAKRMGLDCVEYGLERWKGKLASTCRLMNDKETSYVPFCQIAGDVGFPGALELLSQVDSTMVGAYRSMLVFDAVVCNTDRHGGNFGILRDNSTGEAIGMAPLFDHNLALFPRDMENDFPLLYERSNESFKPANSGLDFAAQSAIVMGKAQHEQVSRLLGFRFENHPRYPIPENRISALNAYIAKKTSQLMSIPVVDEKELSARLSARLVAGRELAPLEIVGVQAASSPHEMREMPAPKTKDAPSRDAAGDRQEARRLAGVPARRESKEERREPKR